MRGQTVHEQRVLGGDAHHVLIHLPIGKILHALFVLGFKSHAGPHIGRHQMRVASSLHRVGEFLVMILAEQPGSFRLNFIAGRGRDMHVEIQYLSGLQPGVAHIVRVPDPCHGLTLYRAALLDICVYVAKYLARMILVGQAVDHRHARIRGKALDDALLEGAYHHQVTHPRDHLSGIFHRLAAPQLRIARIQIDRRTTELLHTGFERQPRACAGLLEDHHQCAISQRPVLLVGLEPLFDDEGALKQVVELFACEVLEL